MANLLSSFNALIIIHLFSAPFPERSHWAMSLHLGTYCRNNYGFVKHTDMKMENISRNEGLGTARVVLTPTPTMANWKS